MSSLPPTIKAIQIQKQGAIEELQLREVPLPAIKDHQVLIKTEWSSVNFKDRYDTNGLYKHPTPLIPGNEVSGRIVQVGKAFNPGIYKYNLNDRVAAFTPLGGYAEYAVADASRASKVPEGITNKTAATVYLQGLTALTAVREAHPVKAGEYILMHVMPSFDVAMLMVPNTSHAAAGGLGLLLVQLAKALGAHVIGTTSTAEKAEVAKKAGADHVVLYKDVSWDDVAKQILALTPNGEGVHATIDGVGKDTFQLDLQVLRRGATLVSIGNASGAVPPIAPLALVKNIKLVRPTVFNYIYTAEETQRYANELWDLVQQNKLRVTLEKEEGYPFTTEGVQQAHRDIESRKTTGKLLIRTSVE